MTREKLKLTMDDLLTDYCCGDVLEQIDRKTAVGFAAYALKIGVAAGKKKIDLELAEHNRIQKRSRIDNSAPDDYYIEPLTDR